MPCNTFHILTFFICIIIYLFFNEILLLQCKVTDEDFKCLKLPFLCKELNYCLFSEFIRKVWYFVIVVGNEPFKEEIKEEVLRHGNQKPSISFKALVKWLKVVGNKSNALVNEHWYYFELNFNLPGNNVF